MISNSVWDNFEIFKFIDVIGKLSNFYLPIVQGVEKLRSRTRSGKPKGV